MPVLTDTYLHWKHNIPMQEPGNESSSHIFSISAVETHGVCLSIIFMESNYFSELHSLSITPEWHRIRAN
jgi:hypothetical protein